MSPPAIGAGNALEAATSAFQSWAPSGWRSCSWPRPAGPQVHRRAGAAATQASLGGRPRAVTGAALGHVGGGDAFQPAPCSAAATHTENAPSSGSRMYGVAMARAIGKVRSIVPVPALMTAVDMSRGPSRPKAVSSAVVVPSSSVHTARSASSAAALYPAEPSTSRASDSPRRGIVSNLQSRSDAHHAPG